LEENEHIKEWGGLNLLDAGLRAARRGWRIFPCDSKKQPIVKWAQAATTDEATIETWAKQWPGALWGRALDKDTLVIDLDVKHGNNGIREFERLQGCKPGQFEAPRVVTGTGGNHIYTNAAGRDFKNAVNKIAPGIDTRTLGGFVIIPSGNGLYRWQTDPDTPPPVAPSWTKAALRNDTDQLEPLAEAKAFQGPSQYGRMLLAYAVEAIESAPGGQQVHTLGSRSLIIGHYIAGGLLEYEPTVEKLIAAGLRMVNTKPKKWTEPQVRKKVVKAVSEGMKHPMDGEEIFRAMAEVNRQYCEDPQLDKDIKELFTALDAQRDEWVDAGHSAKDVPGGEEKLEEPQGEQREQDATDSAGEQPQSEHAMRDASEPLSWLKPGEQSLIRRMGQGVPAPVAFLIDGLIHEIGTGIVVSKYLGGKTFIVMAMAACVTTGRPFAGREVRRRGAALWLAAEGEREVDKRIRAALRALDCDPDAQPIYVQIASVPKLLSHGGEQAVMELVKQAQRAAQAEFGVPLALVVFDTMIKAAGYKRSENDSVEVNSAIQVMDNISIRAKCFVLALDHMGKNEGLGARGSSDKPSSVDVYIELKSNGKSRVLHTVKVKGEKANEQIDFNIVGTELDDGQTTGYVRWGKWCDAETGSEADRSLIGTRRCSCVAQRMLSWAKGGN
jgi:hypothetical protein